MSKYNGLFVKLHYDKVNIYPFFFIPSYATIHNDQPESVPNELDVHLHFFLPIRIVISCEA